LDGLDVFIVGLWLLLMGEVSENESREKIIETIKTHFV
jgi:hypothetical protein